MTNAENNQLIADVARDIIAQTAPQELPLFRTTSAVYFKNSDKALKIQSAKDAILGFGTVDVVSFLTPAVLVAVTEVVTFVIATVKESLVVSSADLISDRTKKMFKKFRPGGKYEASDPTPLNLEQIARVRKLTYERFLQLKLSDAQANRLADAVVAALVSESS